MTTKLQFLIIHKQYQQVQQQLNNIKKQSLSFQQQIIIQMSKIRMSLYEVTAVRKQIANFIHYQNMINQISQNYINKLPNIVLTLHTYAMKAFLFQVQTNQNQYNKQEMERKFIKDVAKLPSIFQVFGDNKAGSIIQKSLYLTISLLQLYIKKNTRIKKKQQKQQLNKLGQLTKNLIKKQPQTIVLCKRLYMIIIHLKIHNLNTFSNDLSDQILEHLDLSIKTINNKQQTLINIDTVVVLLYNSLKVMLGFNQLNQAVIQKLEELYKLFDMKNMKRSYAWHILQMFFIIKIVIFKKKQQKQENDKIQQKLSQFSQKFSVFVNMNLDQIIVSLNQITRNIVRHKVASLATIIGIKLGTRRFSKDFLQIMHDSPFNNDVQTIKLCFQLFQFRQYQKIQNLLQTVLSVPATKKLKMRQVLVAMCSFLIGLFLQHRQQGLLYNKLNHENFLSLKNQNQRHLSSISNSQILKQQTFLQHVGFGYYNVASHQVYLQNRQIYLTKALQNFIESYSKNSQNYLLNYCMGKLYLQMYDYQNAYKHAMQACKSHRGSWAPFCLLACVYMCDRKFQKAFLLIEQLLKKYHEQPILHYIRAYLQVNRILLQVEHDQQIQAAKMLGDQYYLQHFQRLLKHKSITVLNQYAQSYIELSLKQPANQTQQNFFSVQNLSNLPEQSHKFLYKIIPLYQHVLQFTTIQNILKILPQTRIQTLFYKASLHEKRKQLKQARIIYQNIIKLNHQQTSALIRLAQLPKSQEYQSYKECYQYIENAGKYINDGQFMLAKGIVLSKLGRVQQANKILLNQRDVAWCKLLPDLLYYY